MLFAGLDLGTGSVKLECYTLAFEKLCDASQPIGLKTWEENGRLYAEQDLGEIINASVKLLRLAVRRAEKRGFDALVIGLSGQSPGLALIDKEARALHPYISWMDRRAVEEAKLIEQEVGWEKIRKLTGLRPDPLFTGPKLLWIKRRKPLLVKRAYMAGQLKDVLYYVLTGRRLTDHTHASETLLYGLERGGWEPLLLEKSGVEDPSLLPSIEEPIHLEDTTISTRRLLDAGRGMRIYVSLGCVDSVCSHMVAESGGRDIVVDTTGTSTCLNFTVEEPRGDPWGAFEVYRHAIAGKWVAEASLPTGGRGLEWLLETLGLSWGDLEDLPRGPSELLFLPFLEGTRSPDWRPGVRGLVYGLSLSTSKGDLVRAYMQGVALWERVIVKKAEEWRGGRFSLMRVVGGGSRIGLWNSIKAGVVGLPVERMPWVDASALGAAVTGMVGSGDAEWEYVFSKLGMGEEELYGPGEEWRAWLKRWEGLYLRLWEELGRHSHNL